MGRGGGEVRWREWCTVLAECFAACFGLGCCDGADAAGSVRKTKPVLNENLLAAHSLLAVPDAKLACHVVNSLHRRKARRGCEEEVGLREFTARMQDVMA